MAGYEEKSEFYLAIDEHSIAYFKSKRMISVRFVLFSKSIYDSLTYFYTPAEDILISVRSLQRSEGDITDPIKYIYS